MSLATLLKHRLVLLHGEEATLSLLTLSEILERLGMAKDDFDLETHSGEGDPTLWFAAASTVPFLAPRRVVVVRHALRIDPEKFPVDLYKTLPETALVILVADEETANSADREARLKKTDEALAQLVPTLGGAVETFNRDEKDARRRVKADLQLAGFKITEPALDVLMDMCGGRYGRAREETDKLLLFARDGQITEADVREVVVPSREFNIWKLLDAILEDRPGDALANLRTILTNNRKIEEEAFRSVLPQLSRQLRLIWQARMVYDAGADPDRIPAEISRAFPAKPDFRKESPYRKPRFMAAARRCPLSRLARCMTILADTDARLKGALDGYSSLETMERMVLEMASALNPRM